MLVSNSTPKTLFESYVDNVLVDLSYVDFSCQMTLENENH